MVVVFKEPRTYTGPPVNFDRPSPQRAPPKESDPQWLKDLDKDGFAVIRGAVPKEHVDKYVDEAEKWLEGFNLGYKRDDPSTWDVKNLPRHALGGLYSQFSFAHAQFVWDAKLEPGVIDIFAKIWGTEKLTVSFDVGSLAVPLPAEQVEGNKKPWPHCDQSPYRPQLHCVQGLLNLLPIESPEDGGLMVVKGSSALFPVFFQEQKEKGLDKTWLTRDNHHYSEEDLQWFFDHGCEWVKPQMGPGDFVVWDSRTIHYGAAPKNDHKRFAIYTCYKPDDYLTQEQREVKVAAFNKGYCTLHDPTDFIIKRDQDAPWNILFPYGKPVIPEDRKKYIGLEPF